MDKTDFARLFEEAVQRGLQQAGLFSPSELLVEFNGKPNPQNPITMEQASDLLWLSPDRFHLIVDIAVICGSGNPRLIFVRPSGHAPVPFSSTWAPNDLGPFKVIGPMTGSGPT